MDTIIHGDGNKRKGIKYFRCKNCGWVGRAERGEYHLGDQREPEDWLRCPCCNHSAHEVADAGEIEYYTQLYYKQKKEGMTKRAMKMMEENRDE